MSKACWVCFVVPLIASLFARYPGYLVGKRLGKTAAHSIAWLFMFLAVATAHLVHGYIDRPAMFARDLHEGLSLSAMMLGIMFATPMEAFFWFVEMVGPKQGKGKQSADIEPGDSAEIETLHSGNPYTPPRSSL